MKYARLSVLAFLILFILISCSKSGTEPVLSPLTKDTVSGAVLWDRITVESDWSSYSEWPEHAGMQPGQSPHGTWHRVYGNRTLFDALPINDGSAPFGSIIVKENFDNNKQQTALTVMAKVDGWDPENGDWFWAMYAIDGEIRAEGSLGGCISCHEGMRSNDYIVISPLDEAP